MPDDEHSLANLTAAAEKLGLKGKDAAGFISEQLSFARDERARAREEEKDRLEMSEREAIRQHELRLAQLQNERPVAQVIDKVTKPKLPTFKDGDDINSFIVRFERVAELLEISHDSYPVHLGSLLSGKALDIYASLSTEITKNYSSLKAALLRGFNKSPDTYRVEFRNLRIKPNETFQQFSIRLSTVFDYWLEAKTVQKDFENLHSFILLDQFLSSLIPDLRTFIKERDVSSLTEAVTLADNWATARNSYPKEVKPEFKTKNFNLSDSPSGSSYSPNSCPPTSTHSRDIPKPSLSYTQSSTNTRDPDNANKTLRCYTCGDTTHTKNRCPQNPSLSTNTYKI